MGTVEQQPATYDQLYMSGGYDAIYHLPYWRSQYYPLFKSILSQLKRLNASSVLDVGCGNGAFGHMCLDKARFDYRGFDFSPVAISMAIQCTSRPDLFKVGDATKPSSYGDSFDAVVCSEVLEHLTNDLDVVGAWPRGTKCVCSVPNFDSRYHERYFKSCEDVRLRYGEVIDIDRVLEVPVPALSDLAIRQVLKSIRRSFPNPRKMLASIGFSRLVSTRKWFVFTGAKR